ncbi:MAG: 7-cyano-7-deazaguanine synthase QueC [Clostridiales bacterium]|nr:7-cyano-7-deazaguanine synthase QueC [Clostridiales bacterium]
MKALVLMSGGLDSTTALALAVEKYGRDQVLALSVSYGQKHSREIDASVKIAEYYGVRRITLDLGEIFKDSTCTLLEGAGADIPHEDYADQLKKTNGAPVSTYVPFRNGLFLSSAAAVALSHGCEVIYYGAHADDAAGNAYPDTSERFNKAMNEAIYIGSGDQLKVEAPFINMTKTEVVAEGARLKVPFELTWSCYEGGQKACGTCGTCRDRLRAFRENGMTDPLEYENGEVKG